MKKITSFLMMAVLCCTGAFAQEVGEAVETQLPENKLVAIGTAQAEMVPGKWYFLQNPRNGQNDSYEYFAVPGEQPKSGGLAEDRGTMVGLSTQTAMEEAMSEQGVSSEAYKARMVRFVAVEGEEGAYNIQFGTGKWMGDGNPKNTATVTNTQYMGGLAGKWNFYLVNNADGNPNTAGRFAWNKYNMQDRVDNNGQGNDINYWNSGELTLESLDWNQVEEQGDAGIIGNNVWQIYDIIVVGELDPYEEAVNALLEDYTTITAFSEGAFIDNLLNGENVGTKPGNYRQEDVDAFLAIHSTVEELMFAMEMEGLEAIQAQYPEAEDIKKLNEDYVNAYNHMIENRVPRSMTGIAPGYYTFNSALYWYTTKNDTVFYTQAECDSINADTTNLADTTFVPVTIESVKEVNAVQVPANIKSLYSAPAQGSDGVVGDWLAWGPQLPKAEFLWKVEAVEGKPTEFRMTNMANGKSHIQIGQSSNSRMELNDTATVCFDFRSDVEEIKYSDAEGNEVTDTVVSFNIRSSEQAADNYYYLHCGGHSAGAGKNGWIVGWSDGGATRWYMSPVDEATAQEWMFGPEAQLRAMIEKGDSIAAAFPAQLEIAKDIETTIYDTDSVVVTADQFYSQYTTEDSQTIPEGQTVYDFMIDGKQSTYWHSAWEGGNQPFKKHYLQVNATEALEGLYAIKLTRRPVSGDHITQLIVKGYVDAPTDETTFEEGTELGTLDLPLSANNETLISKTFDATGMNYLRFYSTATAAASSGGGSGRGYWHASEFNVFKASSTPRYATTQYDARKAEADALAAAVAVWEEKGFAADSIELFEDETFKAAYAALLAAGEAWSKVFVDPTALREAIAAAPAENLFVIGNNPGQWKEGVVTPSATVAAAEAYNAAGKYTPAESEAHLAAIAKAEADVWAAANKVETGKWYRIKFATEEMYDNYGWNKAGSEASFSEAAETETAPSLWGKTVAVGKGMVIYKDYTTEEGEPDTIAVRSVEVTEEWYDGDNLCFFEDEEFTNGEDLFQFIQATDSSYMIQNKATGLYLHAGHPVTLSAVPSYFSANQAIGAGANLIAYTDVLGNSDRHCYLHGERSTNFLTKWEANTIGSNSMMFIEEAEAVTEAPTNVYTKKLWPGKVYTFTYPVDVTVKDGATAYGAELVVAEEDTAIVLKTVEFDVIKAGSPFILIANLEGDYKTTSERLSEIAAEITAENGKYGLVEKQTANTRVNDEYALVEMEHGVKVDTVLNTLLDLRGTLKNTTVKAGKAVLAKENGFEHTLVDKTVSAYGAWIVADFDPESTDILGGLVVKIEGNIESGINEVLNKVAQSGNIYNAAGQLVGKGNINTINKLPAGIYVVNGVKVTKK